MPERLIDISSSELEPLRTGAAVAPINDRAFLRITGSDATRWLNGMVTNNIKDLAPGEGNYNFLLNAQGRIQGDCVIYREPGDGEPTFLLETDTTQLDTIHQLLDKFIIMDDVELSQAFEGKLGTLVVGSGAHGTLDVALMSPTPPISIYQPEGFDGCFVLALSNDRFEVWADSWTTNWMGDIERRVPAAGLEAHRILSGTPRYGTDITDRDLPQETAQTHALHFTKGCYLGQEIVERIHSRGQVHRTFSRFTLTGEPPTLPAPLTVVGKPAGEVTSAARIDGTIHALGYIRREHAAATLAYPGGTAVVTPR